MQLHSINQTHQSAFGNTPPNNEQLLVLAQIFLRRLRSEIPESEDFQVRCAISHQRVMVLVERPPDQSIETDKIVIILAQTLEKYPEYITPQVEFFLRKLGAKRPYAKRVVTFHLDEVQSQDVQSQTDNSHSLPEESSALILRKSSALAKIKSVTKSIPPLRMQAQMDTNAYFDPFAGVQNSRFSRQNIIVGLLVAGFAGLIGAGYVLTRPCVLNECKALQDARKLDLELKQFADNSQNISQNISDLQQLQIQIDRTRTNLKSIPQWSSRNREVAALRTKLLTESEAVTQMVEGIQKGAVAVKQTRNFTDNVNELNTQQQLWRNAIAPLESIRPNSAFYHPAQKRLSIYRNGLQAVNVQLLAQGKWQQRLNAAKAVADTAMQRDTNAKTLADLQQAEKTWQVVINALKNIPQTSPVYLQSQQLLTAYQPKYTAAQTRVRNEQQSGQLYNQARNAAQLAETAMQTSQWQQAVSQWQQALNLARQVAPGTSHYQQAQPLVDLYASALAQARTQITNPDEIEIARRDLEKTCQGETRICNFSLANKAITVRMTPDYERTLEANLQTANSQGQNVSVVTSHLQTLQTALEAISDNADLPLFVFDAQGAQIYTHIPRPPAN